VPKKGTLRHDKVRSKKRRNVAVKDKRVEHASWTLLERRDDLLVLSHSVEREEQADATYGVEEFHVGAEGMVGAQVVVAMEDVVEVQEQHEAVEDVR
jgi:hypothetical protein